jgi:hypothetical protein
MTEFEDSSTPIPTDTTPAPASDGKSFEASMDASMNAVFDRMENRAEKRDHVEAVVGPPAQVDATASKSIDETFERTFDYLNMPKAEQQKLADERQRIDEIKKFAGEHNLSFAEAQAYKHSQQPGQPGQLPPELSKSIESVRELYPSDEPSAVFEQYAAIDKMVKADPIHGIAWIAQQSGVNPLQLAQGLAVRYGDQTALMTNAERIIDDWFGSNPDAAQFENLMVEAIESGAVKRTGHMASDLEAAFKHAQKVQKAERKQRKQGKHLDRSFAEIYDRAAARRK